MEARGGKRETEAELRKQTAPQTCLFFSSVLDPVKQAWLRGRHWGHLCFRVLQHPKVGAFRDQPGQVCVTA